MPDVELPDTQDLPLPAAAAAQGVLSGNALAPAPAAAPPANDAHSAVGKVFHGILSTLGGGGTEPQMDANGQITEQPAHRTGGEWARRLLAGALTGMAAGAAAPVRPGGAAAAGLGAGFEGEERALSNQDALKRQQLQKNFENRQKQQQQQTEQQTAESENQVRRAQTAYLTTQNTALGLQLSREKAEATDKAVETFNSFQKAVGANPENQDLGVFPDMNAVLTYRKEHPELVQQIAGHGSGQIVAVPNLVQGEDGAWKYDGVRAALVKPNAMEMTVAQVFGQGEVPGIPYFVPGKMQADGKQAPGEWNVAAPAPGTRYGDYLAALQKSGADAARENGALQAAQVRAENARAEAETADAALKRTQTQQLLGEGIDELGRPLPPLKQAERDKRYDTFTKDFVKDKDQLEQSWSQMNSILGRAAKGQMTGADSVVGLFNAIGISSAPLKGRGFRINSNIVGEHVGARNIFQSAAAGLSKLTPNGTGEVVTPQQLQAYANILGQARHDMYVTMAQEAERQGLPKDFLPRGNGAAIDAPTAKIFFDSYGNDPMMALRAAQKFGWAVPAVSGTVQ